MFLVDSDGYIYSDALRELLKPLRDGKVSSVVGHILPRNHSDSIITRMQDILYTGAFRIGRASQSVGSSVLVCSGALSVHRKQFILNNLEFFAKGEIFGIQSDAGDDRALTMLALKDGFKTKYQSTALCITDVPQKTKHFFKQQVRWNKSFFLYTFYSLRFFWKKPIALFWTLGEGLMWLVFFAAKLLVLLNGTTLSISLILIYTFAYLALTSFIHGMYYIFRNPFIFLLAPIFALIHMLILVPTRIYALLTIKQTKWGTR